MDNEFTYSTQTTSRTTSVDKLKNKKLGCGCGSIFAVVIILVLYFFAYHLIFPSMFPKSLRGDLQGLVLFPSKDGKDKLWLQTDGSFSYISETKSPGSYSVGRKGFFCKTFSYVYDPVSKEVLNGFKTDKDYLPETPVIMYNDGKIWVITERGPATVFAYNSEIYSEVINSQSFCSMAPELSAGIEKIYVDKSLPVRLDVTARDGRKVFYVIKDNKFFKDFSQMRNYYAQNDSSLSAIFMLENEQNSDKRKKLYLVSGPVSELYFSSPRPQSIISHKGSRDYKLSAELLDGDKAFIEGELLYFDNDIAVIIHQDNIGKNANRMLTCVAKNGKELWTAGPDVLFEDIKATEKNSFSDMFFMKSKFEVQRSGNTVMFLYKPEGAIAFDLTTGKKLWEFED